MWCLPGSGTLDQGTVTMMVTMTLTIMTQLIEEITAHGRLMDPPARNSMWRLGFNNPINYNDNELYCGGRMVQWIRNGGKCGVCGDAYHAQREHEAGGKYANGVITRTYHQGDVMPVTVHLTANHQGWFEMRICPVNDPKKTVTQECLDKHVLLRADGEGEQFPVPKGKYNAFFNYSVQLPDHLTCTQCVVQWKYRTGNTWDKDDNSGVFCLGCGPQEEFYNCADIEILPDKAKKAKIQSKADQAEKLVKQENNTTTEPPLPQTKSTESTTTTTTTATTSEIPSTMPPKPYNSKVEVIVDDLEDKKRVEVKGQTDNEVTKPKEDRYSWHAASPISWAIARGRPSPIDLDDSDNTVNAEPKATGLKSPFTPPPRIVDRTTAEPAKRPLTLGTTVTLRPAITSTTERYTTLVATTTKSPSTTTTSPSTTTTLRQAVTQSNSAAGSSRQGMPNWLVKFSKADKEPKNSPSPDEHQVKAQVYSGGDIESRRELFRQKLWRHLQRLKQRPENVTSDKSYHRNVMKEVKAEDAVTTTSTKVTPTCFTSVKKSQGGGQYGDVFDADSGRPHDSPSSKSFRSNTRSISPFAPSQMKRLESGRNHADGTPSRDPSPVAEVSRENRPRSGVQFQPMQHLTLNDPMAMPGRDSSSRWWQDYSNVMWNPQPESPTYVAGLICRATIRLGGGMDDWCTANCNANYCPTNMCICHRKQDSFSPTYELVQARDPLNPATWTSPYKHPVPGHASFGGHSPLRLSYPSESHVASHIPTKSIFPAPSSFDYNSEKAARMPYISAYSRFVDPRERRQAEGARYRVGGVPGWNRNPVCRATGHYEGLPHYDTWCNDNCAQAICPLMMCTCDTF